MTLCRECQLVLWLLWLEFGRPILQTSVQCRFLYMRFCLYSFAILGKCTNIAVNYVNRASPRWMHFTLCSSVMTTELHTNTCSKIFFFFFFFFSSSSVSSSFFYLLLLPLALQPTVACRTISFQFSLSITNSLHLLTPSTWRSLSSSSFYPFLCLPLRLVPSSSWVKIFLGILSSSILSRWRNQLIILCPFIHFTIFSPLLISSSSRLVLHFHFPFWHLRPYILLNIFLSKTRRACSSFFVIVHASAPYDTTGLIGVSYNRILVALDKSLLLKRLIKAK